MPPGFDRLIRILVIADPHIPVPPALYGGTERIAHLLCAGLAGQGHAVTLVAAEGSRTYGDGRLFTHRAPSAGKLSRAYRKLRFQAILYRAARGADVVINHGRPDYLWWLYGTRIPIVVQFHNPVDQAQVDAVLARRRQNLRFVGISRDQIAGLEPAGVFRVAPNAIDPAAFAFRDRADAPPYVAFLGRLTANKGVHLAIDAATSAGVRLKIAGTVSDEPGGREYFETAVKPRLGSNVEFVGPVDDAQKASLLGGATALLFPIQWREPFGIVMAEALACGCPVIGWRNGSVPEVIRDGETGFVVDSVAQMVEAIGKVGSVDRAACRRDAEERFSPDVLVDNYLRVINELLAAKGAG